MVTSLSETENMARIEAMTGTIWLMSLTTSIKLNLQETIMIEGNMDVSVL